MHVVLFNEVNRNVCSHAPPVLNINKDDIQFENERFMPSLLIQSQFQLQFDYRAVVCLAYSNYLARPASMSTAATAMLGGAKWFELLPKPRSSPRSINVEELHSLLHDKGTRSGVIVVDVRRTDIIVGDMSFSSSDRSGSHGFHDTICHQPSGSNILSDSASSAAPTESASGSQRIHLHQL